MASPKQQFLDTYDREHATTMRVLRAFPKEKADSKLHPNLKTARELAWTFVMERYLGVKVWHDELAKGVTGGKPPAPPERWEDLLTALEKASGEYRSLIASATDSELNDKVHFFVAPKTMGEYTRLDWARFLLSDEIHHRGQLSVYVRMAEGKLPSIYGPSADEPWV
jgi:uncharacterized damage-inducible protein DinB